MSLHQTYVNDPSCIAESPPIRLIASPELFAANSEAENSPDFLGPTNGKCPGKSMICGGASSLAGKNKKSFKRLKISSEASGPSVQHRGGITISSAGGGSHVEGRGASISSGDSDMEPPKKKSRKRLKKWLKNKRKQRRNYTSTTGSLVRKHV